MNDSITNGVSQLKPKNNQYILELVLRLFLGCILLLVVFFALGLGLIRLWLGPQLENTLVDSQKLNNWLPSVMVEKKIKVEINAAKIDWGEWLSPTLILKNVNINKDSNHEVVRLNRIESNLGFSGFFNFLQNKPVLGDIIIDKTIIFVEKNKPNKESNFLLAGLPLIFFGREEEGIIHFSPNQIQINQIKLVYEEKAFNAGGVSKSIDLGSVKIQNEPNQLKILFEKFTTNSLLSIASITGNLPENYLKFQGSVNSLVFRFPKNFNEGSINRDDLFDSIIVEAQFEGLGITDHETNKGFSGLDGSFLFNSSGIDFNFFSKKAELFLPVGFLESSLKFSDITGKIGLDSNSLKKILIGEYTEFLVKVNELNLSNSDLKIKSRGVWTIDSQGIENAELKGEISFDKAEAISDYLPKKMSRKARNWFKRGLKRADAVNGSFLYEGPINNTSNLSNNKKKKFVANLNVKNLDLLFSSKWPLIRKINAEIEFNNEQFRLVNASGFLSDSKLVSVNGEIVNIFSKTPVLVLSGEVSGLLKNFIHVSNNSPIKKWLWNISENALGEGNVNLDLSLVLDLKKIKNSKTSGILKFDNNSLVLKENFIPMKKIRGEINFSEKSLSKLAIESEILGGKVNFKSTNTSSFKRGIYLTAKGILQGNGFENWINETFEISLDKKVVGSSEYQADIRLFKGNVDITINSDLRGLFLDLPNPLFKDSENSWKLKANFFHRPILNKKNQHRIWDIRVNNGLIFLIDTVDEDLVRTKNNTSRRKKFAILFDKKNSNSLKDEVLKEFLNDSHNKIFVNNPTLDLKKWVVFVNKLNNISSKNFFKKFQNNSLKFELGAEDLKIGDYNFTNFYAQTLATENGFSGIFKSVESTGVFNWNQSINEIKVHLSHYHQKEKNNDLIKPKLTNLDFFTDGTNWPSINLFIDEFKSFNFEGKLALKADYLKDQKLWNIEKIEIYSEMTRLDASGFWNKPIFNNVSRTLVDNEDSGKTFTELDFRIETKNGANVLEDFGHSGLLSDSGGIISGQLKWTGSPLDFRVKNTSGDISLDIQKGKFLKAEPGLARLIGVLNLQSLPKRIKLDFQDVFSEGFSFDKLRGNVAINKGIANTSNLRVIGTQASVFLEGNVDLLNQTQDMRVLVLPELNAGLASLGYVLVNPAVGLGSFLAQYILRDPLRKILAYEYKLKGSWNSPVVEVIPQKNASKDEPSIYQNP